MHHPKTHSILRISCGPHGVNTGYWVQARRASERAPTLQRTRFLIRIFKPYERRHFRSQARFVDAGEQVEIYKESFRRIQFYSCCETCLVECCFLECDIRESKAIRRNERVRHQSGRMQDRLTEKIGG